MSAPFNNPPNSQDEATALGNLMSLIRQYINATPLFAGIEVIRSEQLTTQGSSVNGDVTFHVLSRKRYAWPQRQDKPLGVGNGFSTDVMQNQELLIQMQVTLPLLSTAASPNPTFRAYTSGDVMEGIMLFLDTDNAIALLNSTGVSLLRLSEVKTTYVIDAYGQHQPVPTATLTLKFATIGSSPLGEIVGLRNRAILPIT